MTGLLSQLQFVTPLALWGLAALPVIWWLLRFVPPRPEQVAFPPLRLLLKLKDTKDTPSKTPWWLLLLRLSLAALLIIGVASPFLRQGPTVNQANGALLLVVDNGFAAAPDWPHRLENLTTMVTEAKQADRLVTLVGTVAPRHPLDLAPKPADDVLKLIPTLKPEALAPDRTGLLKSLQTAKEQFGSVLWLSDSHNQKSGSEFSNGLSTSFGSKVKVITLEKPSALLALTNPKLAGGDISIGLIRQSEAPDPTTLQAKAADGHILSESEVSLGGASTATATITLPTELRNEIQNLQIKDQPQASAIQLLDDRWKRKTLAIETSAANTDETALLSPTHYLTQAFEPYASLLSPSSGEELKAATEAGLSMLVLADVGKLPQDDHDAISKWVEKGGLLLRFAGPHMAAASDDLLPVKLREGDRSLGSALSWETPQAMAQPTAESPFNGTQIDPQIAIIKQVLAEPDADLSAKTWASLADGTPLVTAAKRGKGLIVLFHVTANADWSNLPLTGTFPAMLKKLVDMAPAAGSTNAASLSAEAQGRFALRLALTGTGEFGSPPADLPSFSEADLQGGKATVQTPAGLYQREGETRAVNVAATADDISSLNNYGPLPAQILAPPQVKDFTAMLFVLAALLFLADCLAAIVLGGLLRRKIIVALLFIAAFFAPLQHDKARADANQDRAMQAALQTRLAFVKTGDSEVDSTSETGLKGLDMIIGDRTSANLGDPVAINIETDEISLYPLLYWPVLPDAQAPSAAAAARLSAFMKNGGSIIFDLRDGGGFGESAGTEALKRILSDMDVPPLEPVPEGHALTKSFYLLNDFPGRYEGGPLWVEAQGDQASASADNVSGIIITSNDFAAAWALDDNGAPLYAVVPGTDRQREMAYRTGVNLVMYSLTGNYKADQIHVPALLERLGKQ